MAEQARVTHNELLQRLQDPWLSLVDVLPEESYAAAHIPGAISLPLREIRENGRSVLRDLNREIVVYCSGPASTLSEQAVTVLKEWDIATSGALRAD
jgi:rhodanese-related sulfurtransferase